MEIRSTKGPLSLANFTQPWSQKFQNFSTFFDAYSHIMVMYKDGFFVMWDKMDKQTGMGENAFTLNLAATYDSIYACSVYPDKSCIALQVSDNSLVLLFLKQDSAEEIKLTFSKAKMIHAMSFLTGEDFNFMVATNVSIDLYNVKTDKMKAKLIKNIQLNNLVGEPQFYFEPITCVTVSVDARGYAQPYYLNLHDSRKVKGVGFQLDLTLTPNESIEEAAQRSLRASQNVNPRSSIGERAMNFFKKSTASTSTPEAMLKFHLAQNAYNRNLKYFGRVVEDLGSLMGFQSESGQQQRGPIQQTNSHKRTQHQVFLAAIYHRVLFFHYNPFNSQIQAYELDPNQTFKNSGHIKVIHSNSITKDLIQFQVVDNLLVIHNIDSKTTQIHDLKLEDWNVPLNKPDVQIVEVSTAIKGQYYTNLLMKEELRFQQLLQSQDVVASRMSMNMGSRSSVMSDPSLGSDQRVKELSTLVSEKLEEIKDQESESKDIENANQIQGKIQIEESNPRHSIFLSQSKMQNVDLRNIEFYSDTLIFVDPFIIIDPVNCSCFAPKLKHERLVNACSDPMRMLLSLLCRTKNRYIFLRELKVALINQQLSLLQVSSLFNRINSVYKQASVERQTYKRKSQQMPDQKIVIENHIYQSPVMESLLAQLQRLGRLRVHMSFLAPSLDELMLEFHPTNRVLTGEAIIFQSEMLEIFKEIIQYSTHPFKDGESPNPLEVHQDLSKRLSSRFVLGVISEFQRALMDKDIPSQPAQQNLVYRYILETREFSTLQNMLQFRVFNETAEMAQALVKLGAKESKEQGLPYFQPALQIGLDMLKKLKLFEDIVSILIQEGNLIKALNFAQEYGIHSLKLSEFQERMEALKREGKKKQAEVIAKRVQEIKKYDEVKAKVENGYKPILLLGE